MHTFSRLGLLALALALSLPSASAQGTPESPEDGPGLRFNGLGRAYIQQSDLGGAIADTDTSTAGQLTDGNFVLDLAVNAQPNRFTEVQGVIRLRNEFGGFFGAGANVEIRELWARGVIADAVRYRLGDMNLALSPYTLFLPEEDGVVNEPELFRPQREVINYEEFYTGDNTRRIQGGNVEFGLAFDKGVEAVDAQAFIGRLRATNFQNAPTRLITGGRVGATSATVGPVGTQARAGFNLSHVWDDLQSGNANTGLRNSVFSFDADITLLQSPAYAVRLVGETGRSFVDLRERTEAFPEMETEGGGTVTDTTRLVVTTEQLLQEDDTFFEIGLAADFAGQGVGVSAMFMDVGPEFYSAAAQSKRIDYARSPDSFSRLGNDRAERAISLFDLTRDQSLYTFRVADALRVYDPRLSDALMAYDPRFSNVLPYGKATPNRRGVRLGATYEPTRGGANGVEAMLDLALLTEIRGQGTTELKDFVLLRAGTDIPVGALAGLGRTLDITFGAQYESTQRSGSEIDAVDLTSLLFETGLAVEVYDRLDLLFGLKSRSSNGSDFIPVIENFNDVRDFSQRFVTDDGETLVGSGIRYRFKDGVYLTIQAQRFSYDQDDPLDENGVAVVGTPEKGYSVGQVFALYSMTF